MGNRCIIPLLKRVNQHEGLAAVDKISDHLSSKSVYLSEKFGFKRMKQATVLQKAVSYVTKVMLILLILIIQALQHT